MDKPWSYAFIITKAEVAAYAAISGDYNPIHLDESAAEKAGLPGPCAHGMFVVAKVLAQLPCKPSSTTFSFLNPIIVGEWVKAVFDVRETVYNLRIYTGDTLAIKGKIET